MAAVTQRNEISVPYKIEDRAPRSQNDRDDDEMWLPAKGGTETVIHCDLSPERTNLPHTCVMSHNFCIHGCARLDLDPDEGVSGAEEYPRGSRLS